MIDETPDREQAAHRPGILARTALRAIDSGLRALQGLRQRIEPAVAEDEGAGARGKRKQSGDDEPATVATPAPPRKTLLHRFLIVVMCLLAGGVAGMLISHRGFSKQLESQQKYVDYMQDEIKQSLKDEARTLGEMRKLQREIAEYRNSLRETRHELEDHKRQIAELSAQLSAGRQALRPADRVRRAPNPVAEQPHAAPRSGTCVTGGADPAGDLLDCIGKFNRP